VSEQQPVVEERPLLGRDPFAEPPVADPFLAGLAALGAADAPAPAWEAEQPVPGQEPGAPLAPPAAERTLRATPPARTHRSLTPPLAEVEALDRGDWLDALLPEDVRRRLTALGHLVQGETPYDRFGLAPETLRRAFPLFHAIYRFWFRVQSEGHERLPTEGPVVLAANHGGLLPFDGAMLVLDMLLHTDPPRLLRSVVERWAGRLPWVNVFFARVGQVIGTRENVSDLLAEGQAVLVFPEGVEGIRKTVVNRYRLQRFHVGFVEQALLHRAPIVPVAVIGNDDQTPILYDVKPLARRLGLPAAPITPTFPWLGPLGLLPYPVPYRIVYGEPLRFHERFGPEAAEDARLVRYLANHVRRAVQQLVDRSR
jgi:1-acyl-sn-glycerol-3-phosphate acyltransferase